MKRIAGNANLLALAMMCVAGLAVAAGNSREGSGSVSKSALHSDRLIVKLKPNYLPKGLNVAQINQELRKSYAVQVLNQFQAATGLALSDLHALSDGAHVLSLHGKTDKQVIDNAIAKIRGLANVEYVEEDRILTIQAVPNDTRYGDLWGMQPVSAVASPSPGEIGNYGADFEKAWDTHTGTGAIVAVVDTRITPHVDIVGAGGTVSPATGNLVSPGYDFITDCRVRGSCPATTPNASKVVAPSPNATDTGDFISLADRNTPGSYFLNEPVKDSSWHGTHVAGTIAAIGNNAAGVIGGAYGAKILPVRVLGKGGGFLSDIMEGMKWAAGIHPTISNPNPAKVINLSLGANGRCSTTEQNTINAVVAAGAVVVVAAGNGDMDVALAAPANCQNIITVAAIARDGTRASYSNFSSPASSSNRAYVTLSAPGGDQLPGFDPGILSTVNAGASSPDTTPFGSIYKYYIGTSMATPHVVATIALMQARKPSLTPADIKNILSSPASVTAFPSFTSAVPAKYDCATNKNCGAGILNARLALRNSVAPMTPSPSPAEFGAVVLNDAVSRTVTFTNSPLSNVVVGTATISGSDATYFNAIINTCNSQTIVPGGTCQITLNYAPSSAGAHSAILTVPDTASGAATVVDLMGSAQSPLTTTPNVTASTIDVGLSTTVDIRYTNPNANSVMTGSVSLSRPAIMATSNDNCSNVTLGSGANCIVTITITPSAAGTYSGTVSLSLTGGGIPAVATISGSARTPAATGGGGGGGGGCSIMPLDSEPDSSLLLAALLLLAYSMRHRVTRRCGATRL